MNNLLLEGSGFYAFSFLLQKGDTSGHTLTIVQNQPTQTAALEAATALALGSMPGFEVVGHICCKLTLPT